MSNEQARERWFVLQILEQGQARIPVEHSDVELIQERPRKSLCDDLPTREEALAVARNMVKTSLFPVAIERAFPMTYEEREAWEHDMSKFEIVEPNEGPQ